MNMNTGKSYPKVTIYGDVVSKSNQYRIITINGHASLKKSDAVKRFEEKFFLQNPLRGVNISGFFEIYMDAYFSSNRKDLDGAFKLVLDVLQSSKTIKNDRNCVRIVANKFVDKVNPRIEFTLVEVGGVERKDSREPGLFG
jgi:Holliday junction resolvase RusA-like endonuclease